MIANLILAAGRSSRMGGKDKLLEPIDGAPILARQVARALKVAPTFVTVPSTDHPRCPVLPKAAQVVAVSGEMSDSLKAGIAALPETCTGVVVLPADMPDVTARDIQAIHMSARETDAPIVRAATHDGLAGHPIYFAANRFPRFNTLNGDRGAFRIISDHEDQIELVLLADDRARLDLDTPEDWAAYRTR